MPKHRNPLFSEASVGLLVNARVPSRRTNDLKRLKVLDLLGLYSDIIGELCEREILRSVNNPAADYAEYLVTKALLLHRSPKSAKGFDAADDRGGRYEIKARRLTRMSRPTRFGTIRKLEDHRFNFLVVVLFDENFLVTHARILPRVYITKKAFWQAHVNGWILPIRDDLWVCKGGIDITSKLRKIQGAPVL